MTPYDVIVVGGGAAGRLAKQASLAFNRIMEIGKEE